MDEELQALIDAAENERDELEEGSNESEQEADGEESAEDADGQEDSNDDAMGDDNGDDDNSDGGDDENAAEDDAQSHGDGEEEERGSHDSGDNGQFQEIEVEVSGTKVKLESMDEVRQFLKNKAAPQGSSESEADMYFKQGNLSAEDVQLLIDAKSGNPEAIARLAQMGKIDVEDLDEIDPNAYQPQFQLQETSPVEAAAQEIMKDDANATAFRNTMSTLPQSFQAEVTSDGERMLAFARHVKSGLAAEIIPLAAKKVALSGGDFFQAYATIGSEIMAGRENRSTTVPPKGKKPMSDKEKRIRNRATASRGSGSTNTGLSEAEEVETMSDADFEKMVSNTRKW